MSRSGDEAQTTRLESRSRRALLAAGLGAIAATAASALRLPTGTRALDGGNLKIGEPNEGTVETKLTNTGSGHAFSAEAQGSDSVGVFGRGVRYGIQGVNDQDGGVAVFGNATVGVATGVRGQTKSKTGTGVAGVAINAAGQTVGVRGSVASRIGTGVLGEATSTTGGNTGVRGTTASPAGVGVAGAANTTSGTNVGVQGTTRSNAGTGVLGIASSTGGEVVGVRGETTSKKGTGVRGLSSASSGVNHGVYGESRSPAGFGIFGRNTSGRAVQGDTQGGVALHGTATSGFALQTRGRVKLESISGKASLSAGTNSVTVTPGVDVTSESLVIATINGDPGVAVTIHRVAINAGADTFTVELTANVINDIRIAWLLLG